MLNRYCNSCNVTLPDRVAQVTFTDQSSIRSSALAAVQKMQRAGIVTGYKDGSFLPQNTVTREEGATFIWRLCSYRTN